MCRVLLRASMRRLPQLRIDVASLDTWQLPD